MSEPAHVMNDQQGAPQPVAPPALAAVPAPPAGPSAAPPAPMAVAPPMSVAQPQQHVAPMPPATPMHLAVPGATAMAAPATHAPVPGAPPQPHPLSVTAPPTVSAFNLGAAHDPNQPAPVPPRTNVPPLQVARVDSSVAPNAVAIPAAAPVPSAPVPVPILQAAPPAPLAAPASAPAAPVPVPMPIAAPAATHAAPVDPDQHPAWVTSGHEPVDAAAHAQPAQPVQSAQPAESAPAASPYTAALAADAPEHATSLAMPEHADPDVEFADVTHVDVSGTWFSPGTALVVAVASLAWRLVDQYARTLLQDKLSGGAALDRFDTIVDKLPLVGGPISTVLGFVLIAGAIAVLGAGWRRGVREPLLQLAVGAVILLAIAGPLLAG